MSKAIQERKKEDLISRWRILQEELDGIESEIQWIEEELGVMGIDTEDISFD